MHCLSILVAAALAASAYARPAPPSTHRLHERREPHHRRLVNRMEPDVVLPMRIGLRQSSHALEHAESWLMELSHPESPSFGQHWSPDKVIETFQPAQETVDTVVNWLVDAGISKERLTHTDNKAWLAFDATVEEAEGLLHTEYYHDGNERATVGCEAYHLPQHIQEHVDFVTPCVKSTVMDLKRGRRKRATTTTQPLLKRGSTPSRARNARRPPKQMPAKLAASSPDDLSTCNQILAPACVQALYQFEAPDPHAKVSPDNTLGIFEEGDYYDQLDLDIFYARYATQVPNGTHPTLYSIDGGVAPVDNIADGLESLLDFCVAYPIIYPQTIDLYQTDDEYYAYEGGGGYSTGFFNTFLDALDGSYCTYAAYGETGNADIDPQYPDTAGAADTDPYKGPLQCGVYEPANIISISYGVYEQDQPYSYQKRQCDEYLKLALQGVTVLFASGDTGAGGYTNGTYGDLGYYGCLGDKDNVFTPSAACSCPWVTNVGATEVFPNRTVYEPEIAALEMSNEANGNYSSSGGFSNIFQTPWYQIPAMEEYYRVSNPPYPYYFNGDWKNARNGGVYNRNGRGIPDVAANGDNYPVPIDGVFHRTGGTSQSAPLFASLLNRIIEERIKIGKGRLGFINPTLYFNPYVLNDITEGVNPGCGTWGFSASEGWDPVTGLGTPNYPKMLDLFLRLP